MTKRRRNHRVYPVQYKRQVAEEYLVDGVPLRELARRHDVERNLIRIWVEKYQAGEFSEETANAEIVREYEVRIATLERKVGQLTMENELLKKTADVAQRRISEKYSIATGPVACPSAEDAE